MLAPVTNSRLQWRTSAVFSTSGPTIIPGVSTSVTTGRSNASHSCRKRAALSAPSLSIAPARWAGLLATTPTGRPSTRASAVTMPRPKSRRSSSTLPVSNMPVDRRAHVVAALAVLGDRRARSSRWSAHAQSATGPWKYDRYCFASGDRLRPRRRPRCRRRRWRAARRSGRSRAGRTRRARRPRSSPGRPCRCWSRVVAMTTSQQPRIAALPAKQ